MKWELLLVRLAVVTLISNGFSLVSGQTIIELFPNTRIQKEPNSGIPGSHQAPPVQNAQKWAGNPTQIPLSSPIFRTEEKLKSNQNGSGSDPITSSMKVIPPIKNESNSGSILTKKIPLLEQVQSIDPLNIYIKEVKDGNLLYCGSRLIKKLSGSKQEALAVIRLLRNLSVNQYGFIPESEPRFDYWLSNGEGPSRSFIPENYVTFDYRSLSVKKLFGVWVLMDNHQVLFQFGHHQDFAESAKKICQKYKFNIRAQLKQSNDSFCYFLSDPYVGIEKSNQSPNILEIISSMDRLGWIIPDIGFIGPKKNLNPDDYKVVYQNGGYQLMCGKELIQSFGMSQLGARSAERYMRQQRVNFVASVGNGNFRFFLSDQQPISHLNLGISYLKFNLFALRVKEENKTFYLFEGNKKIVALGSDKEDAEIILKLLQYFKVDHLAWVGDNPNDRLIFWIKKSW